jgi:hypothetical protein
MNEEGIKRRPPLMLSIEIEIDAGRLELVHTEGEFHIDGVVCGCVFLKMKRDE